MLLSVPGRLARSRSVAVVALVSLLLGGVAAPVYAGANGGGYLLAAGDRVVVTVLGQPELGGELPVDGDGDISLALVGPTHVEGLTTKQAQDLIRARLSDGYVVNPGVSVRLGEPRPLYVLGSVRSPGAYPFRFGTVAVAAIAAAGGVARWDTLQQQSMADALSAEERLQQLLLERTSLMVRRARLEAQVDGVEAFTVPRLETPPPGDLERIVATEIDALAVQVHALKSRKDLLQAQKPRLERQVEAARLETAAAKARLDLVRNEIGRSDALLRQGLGTRAISVQFKLAESTEEANVWRLTSEALRLERELGEIDLRVQSEELSVRHEAAGELRTVRSRLGELELLVPAAQAQRDWKLRQAGSPMLPEGGYRITITRVRDGNPEVTAATGATVLQPGDVVEVRAPIPNVSLFSSAGSDGAAAQ